MNFSTTLIHCHLFLYFYYILTNQQTYQSTHWPTSQSNILLSTKCLQGMSSTETKLRPHARSLRKHAQGFLPAFYRDVWSETRQPTTFVIWLWTWTTAIPPRPLPILSISLKPLLPTKTKHSHLLRINEFTVITDSNTVLHWSTMKDSGGTHQEMVRLYPTV